MGPRDSEAPPGEEDRRCDGRAQTVEEGECKIQQCLINKHLTQAAVKHA